MNDSLSEKTWWIVFGFGIVIVVAQSILLIVKYNFETPKYLFERMKDDEGIKLVKMLYKE